MTLLSIYKKINKKFGEPKILKKIPFLAPVDKFIRDSSIPKFVHIDGNKIFLDSKDTLHLSTKKIYEELGTEIVKKEVKEGDIVIDIGANIGYFTLLFAKLVGPAGKVYSFEPEPSNFSILKKNVKVNEYRNVILEKRHFQIKLVILNCISQKII